MKPSFKQVRTYKELDGQLSVVEQTEFPVKRVFWITNLHKHFNRAQHAHKKLRQFIVAVSGHCKIKAYDPSGNFEFFRLSSPDQAVDVPPGNWLVIYDFDPHTVLMVLASENYDTSDYISDPKEFFNGEPPI